MPGLESIVRKDNRIWTRSWIGGRCSRVTVPVGAVGSGSCIQDGGKEEPHEKLERRDDSHHAVQKITTAVFLLVSDT